MDHYSINPDIDQIKFGDLTLSDKNKISFKDPIIEFFYKTGLICKFFEMTPPKNSSGQTFNELKFLEKVTNNASLEDILFSTNAEINEIKMYANFCKSLNLNLNTKFFNDLLSQVEPILMLLKQHHNRARPNQIAPFFNIKILYKVPTEITHGAYPSGHSLDAFLVRHILTQMKPESKEQIYSFCDKMSKSRFIAGVHYPSDEMISKILADTIIQNNLLRIP